MPNALDVQILNLPVKPIVIVMPEQPALPEPFLSIAERVHWAHFDFKRYAGALLSRNGDGSSIETRFMEARQKRERGPVDHDTAAVLEIEGFCGLVERYAMARDKVTHLKRVLGECGIPHVVASEADLELSALEAARAELDMRRDLPGAKRLGEVLG